MALPPDPDKLNWKRAGWADDAICEFVSKTGSDPEDCLSDLLCDLRHWADRSGDDFEEELARANRNYLSDTTGAFSMSNKGATTTMLTIEDRYLGDGVYASFDGYQVWLDLRDGTTRIALDPHVQIALFNYVRNINSNVKEDAE